MALPIVDTPVTSANDHPPRVQLDPFQQQAVTAAATPLLVIAGPGSGKTRVLTERIGHLIAGEGIPPHQIVALTFTNKAANEMRTRLAGSHPEAAADVWMGTFHSVAFKLLRRNPQAADRIPGFSIVDPAESRKMLATAILDTGIFADVTDQDAKRFLFGVAGQISACKNSNIDPASAVVADAIDADTHAVWVAYEHALKASNSVDFDDLLVAAARMARTDPWLQTRFAHVLVDEFQDTNTVQQDFVTGIAGGGITCVGDIDQSIYQFRGANGAAVDMFTSAWPAHRVVILENNYRSTGAICRTVSSVISPNPARHRCPVIPVAGPGSNVQVVTCGDDTDEAVYATNVARQLPAGESFAILVRANSATRAFEKALTDAAIPHAVVGALRFAERAEVKDALAWLRIAANPFDVAAFTRAASSVKRGVGAATVAAVTTYASAHQVRLLDAAVAVADTTPRARRGLMEMVDAIAAIASADTVEAAADAAVDATGLRASVRARDDHDDALSNLDELVAVAAACDSLGETVADCVAKLALVSAADTNDGASTSIVISTIHAAKGKEFDTVMVAGLEEGTLPHVRAQTREEVAEERRLLFVACSRARRQLIMTRAEARFDPRLREKTAALPSQFLTSLPEAVCDFRTYTRPRTAGHQPRTQSGFQPAQAAGTRYGSRSAPPAPAQRRTTVPPAALGRMLAAEQRVRHHIFGPGVVRAADDTTVTVAFADSVRMFPQRSRHLQPE